MRHPGAIRKKNIKNWQTRRARWWNDYNLDNNLDYQPWLKTLITNLDYQHWLPTLTTNLDYQFWLPTMTTNLNFQPKLPILNTKLDYQSSLAIFADLSLDNNNLLTRWFIEFFCTTCFDLLVLITCWLGLQGFKANPTESECGVCLKSKLTTWPKKWKWRHYT